MLIITGIKIKKFRSLEDVDLFDTGPINVIFGKNDSGKSNVLKSLNLFFNGFTDTGVPYDYDSDYNAKHKKERKRKEKRYVQVKITFNAPYTWTFTQGSFGVLRKWDIEGNRSETYYDNARRKVTSAGAKRAISVELNKIKYLYLPAIRGREFLEYLYSLLQESLFAKERDKIEPAIGELRKQIVEASKDVERDFLGATNIDVEITVPEDLTNLYRSFEAITELKEGDDTWGDIALRLRGDGIQARFMASLLNFVATQNSEYKYIWGFEEPENSLEYNMAFDLLEKMVTSYFRNAQIFITSHSPAFIGPDKHIIKKYCAEKEIGRGTIFTKCSGEDGHFLKRLSEVNRLYGEFRANDEEIKQIKSALATEKRVLIAEGPCDVRVLIHFWNLFYAGKKREISYETNNYFRSIEMKGDTDDDPPESGSNKRLGLGRGLTEFGAKVLIVEDRDNEKNEGKIDRTYLKRRRLKRRNIDSYFLKPSLVAQAFGVSEETIKDIYNTMGHYYVENPSWLKEVNGKKVLEGLNKHFGRTYDREETDPSRVAFEAYHIAEKITDPDEIPQEFKEIVECIKWVIA